MVPQKSLESHLTGSADFIEDIDAPGQLYIAFVRSPVAHARVLEIDGGGAEEIEGAVAFFTRSDLEDLLSPGVWREFPLASSEVVYQGQPVAAVVSSERQSLEDCLDAVKVSYDRLPVVSDPVAAVKDKQKWLSTASTNVVSARERGAGHPSEVLRTSPHRLRLRFTLPRISPYPLEGRGMVIERTPEETVVYSSTQSPQILQNFLSGAAVESGPLRVSLAAVGGAFGSKVFPYAEDLASYLVSLRLRRNVKWTPFPGERLVTLTHRPDQTHDVRVGYDDAGRILALTDDVVQDAGAYFGGSAGHSLDQPGLEVGQGSTPMEQMVKMMTGPYRVRDVRVRVKAVATNKVAMGPIRGSGYSVATFVLERVLNVIAGELGLDHFSVRRSNLIGAGSGVYVSPLGLSLPQLRFADLLASVERSKRTRALLRRASSSDAKTLRGLGVSFYLAESAPPSEETVRLELTEGGRLRLFAGVAPSGQGSERTLTSIVSRRLHVSGKEVEVRFGDAMAGHLAVGTTSSRSIVFAGSAAVLACQLLVRRLSARLGRAGGGRVTFEGGVFRFRRRGGGSRELRFGDVAKELGGGLTVVATYRSETPTFSTGCHVSLAEVDRSSGRVRVVDHLSFDDFGTILDRSALKAQVEGGVMQSIGEALQERIVYDRECRLDSAYFVPSILETPRYFGSALGLTTSQHPHGARGAGEAGRIGSLPAIVNAVENALRGVRKGVFLPSIPMEDDSLSAILSERLTVG